VLLELRKPIDFVTRNLTTRRTRRIKSGERLSGEEIRGKVTRIKKNREKQMQQVNFKYSFSCNLSVYEFHKIIERAKMKAEVDAYNAEKRIMQTANATSTLVDKNLPPKDLLYVKLKKVPCLPQCLVEGGKMLNTNNKHRMQQEIPNSKTEDGEDIVETAVSCDGKWQRRGFASLQMRNRHFHGKWKHFGLQIMQEACIISTLVPKQLLKSTMPLG
jgi:hypothetical protein